MVNSKPSPCICINLVVPENMPSPPHQDASADHISQQLLASDGEIEQSWDEPPTKKPKGKRPRELSTDDDEDAPKLQQKKRKQKKRTYNDVSDLPLCCSTYLISSSSILQGLHYDHSFPCTPRLLGISNGKHPKLEIKHLRAPT